MMDTPTPARGIKLDDVFHDVPSSFPSFTDIDTPRGEAGTSGGIANNNQNKLAEGGGTSPHMDFNANIRNIP